MPPKKLVLFGAIFCRWHKLLFFKAPTILLIPIFNWCFLFKIGNLCWRWAEYLQENSNKLNNSFILQTLKISDLQSAITIVFICIPEILIAESDYMVPCYLILAAISVEYISFSICLLRGPCILEREQYYFKGSYKINCNFYRIVPLVLMYCLHKYRQNIKKIKNSFFRKN